MGLKTHRTNPTLGRGLKVIAAVVLVGMMGLGALVEFVPAPMLEMRRVWLPLFLVGVGFTAWVLRSRGGREHLMSAVSGRFLRLLTVLAMPFIYSMLCWVVLAKGLPWLYTSVFGSEVRESKIMLTSHQHSRWSCDWRLTEAKVGGNPFAYLCISLDTYQRHPDQWVHVVLRGRRSALGLSVQDVIVGDATGESSSAVAEVPMAQMLRKMPGGAAY